MPDRPAPLPPPGTPAGGDDRAALAHLDARLDRIAQHPFRAKFHLRGREREMVQRRGIGTVRQHARELLTARLAPAHPTKDGKQTPWGGHPVFRAQHATGTCCRSCLLRWHGVAKGRPMTPEELDDAVAVIVRWVEREMAAPGPRTDRSAPTLW